MALVLELPNKLESELSNEATKAGLSLADYALRLLSSIPISYQQNADTKSAVSDGLIVSDPKLRGGRPIIAGTGTAVRTIASLYKLGLSPEDVAGELPLSLAQIYAALAYYHLHQAEIDADIAADSESAPLEQTLYPLLFLPDFQTS